MNDTNGDAGIDAASLQATDAAHRAETDAFEAALQALAEDAGITTVWHDYRGVLRVVAPATLRSLLGALELPAATSDEIAASRTRLAAEAHGAPDDVLPPLLTAAVNAPIVLPFGTRFAGCDYRVVLDDPHGDQAAGDVRVGRFADDGPSIVDAIDRYGYHRFECGGDVITLALAPPRCYGEDALPDAGRHRGERLWGLAAQIYSLADDGDGGLGHFGALGALAREAARHGASALAISPVHAMFSADLHRCSPYGPSSRLLTNVLHVDPRAVLDDAAFEEALDAVGGREELARLASGTQVDWPASSRLRLALLRRLFERVTTQDDETGRALRAAFDAFRATGGDVLEAHARFEALHAVLAADDAAMLGGWRNWPIEFRDPDSDAVRRFAEAHESDVAFHAFLQWQAARQLDTAQRIAVQVG